MTQTENQTTTEATEPADVAVTHIDPRQLLVDINIRLETQADKDLIASIRDLGVLQPIVAVTTNEGQVRVRLGHRRTLGAIEAGRETVPVLVVGAEDRSDAGQIERLIEQFTENERRSALSDAEHVNVVAQLSAFGLSAAQITKRTRMTRPRVDAALTVAGSDLATAATARYELTIDQAAVIADFAEDTETVKALITAAKTGHFDHVAQRARDDRAEQEQYTAEHERLTAAGFRIINEDDLGAGRELFRLTDQPETSDRLEPQAHAECPGHAAYIDRHYSWDWRQHDLDQGDDDGAEAGKDEQTPSELVSGYRWVPVWVCTDPAANGHSVIGARTEDEDASPATEIDDEEQREAARAARRDVIESNKAWASAETVRREWLRTFATRKTAPKGTAAFVALAHVQDSYLLHQPGGPDLAHDLLGLGERSGYGHDALQQAIIAASEARAQVTHLVMVLAAYEDGTDREHWRTRSSSTVRYLRHLASLGYTLSEVEQRAVDR